MRNYPLLVVGTVLFMSACQTPEPPAPRDVTAEIQEANAQLETALSAGDASEAADVYEADALLMLPDGDAILGRDEIRTWYRAGLDQGMGRLDLATDEAVAITNQAVEVGQYRMFASEDSLVEKGKYMVWWKLTDGGWKIYRDIWNRDAHS